MQPPGHNKKEQIQWACACLNQMENFEKRSHLAEAKRGDRNSGRLTIIILQEYIECNNNNNNHFYSCDISTPENQATTPFRGRFSLCDKVYCYNLFPAFPPNLARTLHSGIRVLQVTISASKILSDVAGLGSLARLGIWA